MPCESGSSDVHLAFSLQDVFNRTIGQMLVKIIFGHSTLSDYINKHFTQRVVRQPYYVSQIIAKGQYKGQLQRTARAKKGTYDEISVRHETRNGWVMQNETR